MNTVLKLTCVLSLALAVSGARAQSTSIAAYGGTTLATGGPGGTPALLALLGAGLLGAAAETYRRARRKAGL